MTPFTSVTSKAIAVPMASIDTDIIFPGRFLPLTEKAGLGGYASYEWRHDAAGDLRRDPRLTDPAFAGAAILVAGDNYGCGSSREQVPWALLCMGIRAVVSTSLGEIFYNNCFKNGMLPVVVDAVELASLLADAATGGLLTVDIVSCQVTRADGAPIALVVEGWQREMLLNGWDEVGMILARDSAPITAFETRHRQTQPWLWPET